MNNTDNENLDKQEAFTNSTGTPGNTGSAQFNTEEHEKAVNERQQDESNNNTEDSGATPPDNQPPLTTQGDISEVEEDFSGTTNLSLDQLKKEGDPEGMNDQ